MRLCRALPVIVVWCLLSTGRASIVSLFDEDPVMMWHRADLNMNDELDHDESHALFGDEAYAPILKEEHTSVGGLVNAIDSNSDGSISPDEFLEFAAPRHEEVTAMRDFVEADRNGNAQLSLDEYRDTNYGMERVLPSATEGFEDTFRALDTNGDGLVKQQEFVSVAGTDRFTRMDTNEDRKITPDEYLADELTHFKHHHEGTDTEQVGAQTRDVFAALDLNQDGVLSRAEDRGDMLHVNPNKAKNAGALKEQDEEFRRGVYFHALGDDGAEDADDEKMAKMVELAAVDAEKVLMSKSHLDL